MNDQEIENFFSKMQQEKLSSKERSEMREALQLRIKGYQPSLKVYRFASLRIRQFAYVTMAVLLVLGVSVASAAEFSLPGDSLYSLKVSVIEPVREGLSLSLESKAKKEAEFAQKRLAEAAELEAKGKLSLEVKDWLFDQAAERVRGFEDRIAQAGASVDEEQAAELASHLEAALNAQVLLIGNEASSTATSSQAAVERLKISAHEVSKLRVRAEERIANRSPEELKAVSEIQLKHAEKEYQNAERAFKDHPRITGKVAADAIHNLDAAKAILEEGRAGLQSGSYKEAIPKLLEAGRGAQGAQILINAAPDQTESTSTPERGSKGLDERDEVPSELDGSKGLDISL